MVQNLHTMLDTKMSCSSSKMIHIIPDDGSKIFCPLFIKKCHFLDKWDNMGLCLQGFRQSKFQTSLLSCSDYLENENFTCSRCRYDTFQQANNKGADQAVLHLCCSQIPKTGFLASRLIWDFLLQKGQHLSPAHISSCLVKTVNCCELFTS